MQQNEFENFVVESKVMVLETIRKFLRHDLVASIDDVAQETYLRAYRYLERNHDKAMGNQSGWLYTIAKNECFRMNEKHKRELAKQEKMILTHQLEQKRAAVQSFPQSFGESSIDIEEDSSGKDDDLPIDLATVKALAQKLEEPFFSVFEGALRGESTRETAQRLKIKEGTVKSRKARAKKMIMQYYYNSSEKRKINNSK